MVQVVVWDDHQAKIVFEIPFKTKAHPYQPYTTLTQPEYPNRCSSSCVVCCRWRL